MNNKDVIRRKINILLDAHKSGLLGGEKMPEDENPGLNIIQLADAYCEVCVTCDKKTSHFLELCY